jgi:hypothetical protein
VRLRSRLTNSGFILNRTAFKTLIPIHESVTTLSWIGIIFLVDSLDVIDPHEFHV